MIQRASPIRNRQEKWQIAEACLTNAVSAKQEEKLPGPKYLENCKTEVEVVTVTIVPAAVSKTQGELPGEEN